MKKWQIRKTAYMLRHTTKKAGFEGLEEITKGLGYSIAVLQEPTNLTAGVLPEQRIIFLPAGVSQEYASQLLAHEIGHIALEHKKTFIDDNTRAELEADYFANKLLDRSRFHQLYKRIAIVCAAACLVCGLIYWQTAILPSSETVYVTAGGSRYHMQDCYHIQNSKTLEMTRGEAEKALYTPCKDCLGK